MKFLRRLFILPPILFMDFCWNLPIKLTHWQNLIWDFVTRPKPARTRTKIEAILRKLALELKRRENHLQAEGRRKEDFPAAKKCEKNARILLLKLEKILADEGESTGYYEFDYWMRRHFRRHHGDLPSVAMIETARQSFAPSLDHMHAT